MYAKSPLINFWHSLHHIASHAVITLIAVAVAFSLPKAATYILFTWWPRMQEDGRGLLYTEIAFAALLVLVMNLVKLAWEYRGRARISDVASLVFAQESGDWLTRWVKDNQMKRMPWKRDLTIKAVTGYGTFAADDSALKTILDDCYELRVMLPDPSGASAQASAGAHADPQATLADMRREVAASIAALDRLTTDALKPVNAAGLQVAKIGRVVDMAHGDHVAPADREADLKGKFLLFHHL